MPEVSEYKALGQALGGYKRTLSDIKGKDYAKDFEERKGEKQRAMYGQIGASVGAIIGIAQEYEGLRKIKRYREEAAKLPGIITEQEEYQPLGKYGKAVGIKTKTRDIYKSASTGRVIPKELMAAIGYRESLGIETKYSVYPEPERPYVPMKDEEVDILEDIELDELSDFSASPKKVSRGLQPRRTVVKPGEMVIDSRGIRSPKLVPPVKKRPKDGSRGLQPRGRVTKPGEMIIDSSGMRVPKPVPPVKKWDKGPYSRPDPYSKHDSVEDNIVGSMMEEDFDMFQIPGIKAGMSDFERDIAKSENMAFWKSDGAEGGVYSDMFMETGKERPASGFGTALREGESSIDFSTAVDRMRESISEAESGVAKIIGEESWGSLDRKQREAITELGYIMGVKGIKTKLPNMIDAIKEGQMELAKQEAMFNMKTGNQAKWITQIGEERAGRILSKLFPDPYEYKSPQSATSLMYYQMPDFLR